MISLALNKNSLNTDQSSIDRITVQLSSVCIKIIFSRVKRKSSHFWLSLQACAHDAVNKCPFSIFGMKYNFVVAGKWQFSFGAWHCMSLLDTKQLSLDRDSHPKN